MRKIIIISLFVCLSLPGFAQKNKLALGGGIMSLPYNITFAKHVAIQYEFELSSRFSVFASLGRVKDDFVFGGETQFLINNIPTTREWGFDYSESFLHMDIGLKSRLISIHDHIHLYGITAFSIGKSIFGYPVELVVEEGTITRFYPDWHRQSVKMAVFGLEAQFDLSSIIKGMFASAQLSFRTTFQEAYFFSHDWTLENMPRRQGYSIKDIVGLGFQVGYRF